MATRETPSRSPIHEKKSTSDLKSNEISHNASAISNPAYSSPFAIAILKSDYMQSPMTMDQFNRYSSQKKYYLANKFSDIIMQYFHGNITLEESEDRQKVFLMEVRLSGGDIEALDDEIIRGFVKNKIVRAGL